MALGNVEQSSKYVGYNFFVGEMELPLAPSSLTMSYGSNNTTVELLNGREISILKNPKLTEIEFEILLPSVQYPFAKKFVAPDLFLEYFEKIMTERTPVYLVINRIAREMNSRGTEGVNVPKKFRSNNILVSLESYTVTESAENAYDSKVKLKFKQYIEYTTIKYVVVTTPSSQSSTPKVETATKTPAKPKTYVIKKGDTLWGIAKSEYGTGTNWTKIYEANKTVIENTAKKYGKKSSSNGHWIYVGCELIIPAK